jgi:hypothetical protein
LSPFCEVVVGQTNRTCGVSITSVATVVTNIFQINKFSMRNKIGKIAKIFVKIEDTKN